jgi:hypothetical protein
MILSLLFLALSIAARSVAELQQHNKLRWQKEDTDYFSFWGRNSWVRKYAGNHKKAALLERVKNHNWYYRFFKIKYKEAYLFSSNFLIWTTDGYHLCQMLSFSFLTLSITFAIGFDWRLLLGVWIGIRLVHGITYWLLSK